MECEATRKEIPFLLFDHDRVRFLRAARELLEDPSVSRQDALEELRAAETALRGLRAMFRG